MQLLEIGDLSLNISFVSKQTKVTSIELTILHPQNARWHCLCAIEHIFKCLCEKTNCNRRVTALFFYQTKTSVLNSQYCIHKMLDGIACVPKYIFFNYVNETKTLQSASSYSPINFLGK